MTEFPHVPVVVHQTTAHRRRSAAFDTAGLQLGDDGWLTRRGRQNPDGLRLQRGGDAAGGGPGACVRRVG